MKRKAFYIIALGLIFLTSLSINCCITTSDDHAGQNNFFSFYLPWDDVSESNISSNGDVAVSPEKSAGR